MRKNKKVPPKFKPIAAKVLLFIILVCFYLLVVNKWFIKGSFYSEYGADYLAYWSAGKIADQYGYTEIYNLDKLETEQVQALESLGIPLETEDSSFSILPVAYFSVFVVPFQILSKMDLVRGYWLWTVLNFILMTGYLLYFLRSVFPEKDLFQKGLLLIVPILFSYTVISNFAIGQVEVLLVICAGEFIRNALNKKPFISGLWLGGMLIKPQVLILILPIILIMRNWKVFKGFLVTSAVLLGASFILSGFEGTKALINLWTVYSEGLSTGHPEAMINWRMVGLNLNQIFNIRLGWVITTVGIALTALALYFLVRRTPPLGSAAWVMTMLGIFSATLAITWHAHHHMGMVLIPFLLYASLKKLIPDNVFASWWLVTNIVWILVVITNGLVNIYLGLDISEYIDFAVAFSGFAVNLFLLLVMVKTKKSMISK